MIPLQPESEGTVKSQQQLGPVIAAAETADFSTVAQLLLQGEDPNEQNALGWSVLHWACYHGNASAVQLLIAAAADVDLPANDGSTPLHLACNNVPITKLLLKAQANVDAQSVGKLGEALPNLLAAIEERDELVQLLSHATAGATFNCQGPSKSSTEVPSCFSMLISTVEHGRTKMAEVLTDAGADINLQDENGCTAVHMAVAEGHVDILIKLIGSSADIDRQDKVGASPLHCAVRNGYTRILAQLLNAQTNINAQDKDGNSPLHIAAIFRQFEAARLLIRAGAKIDLQNVHGYTCLHCAVNEGDSQIVSELISARAALDTPSLDGYTALYLAAKNGEGAIASMLIGAGSNIDLQENDGWSPLHIAVAEGHTAIVAKLLRAGASQNPLHGGNEAPIQTAIRLRRFAAFKLLISEDLDAELHSLTGQMHLMYSASTNSTTFAIALIKAGVPIDPLTHSPQDPGYTALHAASTAGSQSIVRALVEAGASTDIRIFGMFTAEHDALMMGHHDVASILQEPDSRNADPPARSEFLDADADSSNVETPCNEQDLSAELSRAMCSAGFKSVNAAIQSGAAAVLQDILRTMIEEEDLFVFGSFSDGWGSCLKTLDGEISRDSDIDVTVIGSKKKLCFDSKCWTACDDRAHHVVQYGDGHAIYSFDATEPNIASLIDVPNTTAIDYISALPCCSYPAIKLLQPGYKCRTGCESHIHKDILQALSQELQSPRCHVVAASPPGQEGRCMRVSTTLLERLLMRQLTTVQGQFFILIKFIIKMVISRDRKFKVNGLKTYIAKNVLFYMLDETPPENWQPQNLLELVRKSLQMLVQMMTESSASDDVCMTHFFLRDANVYFKKDHHPKADIIRAVTGVIDVLPQMLRKFQSELRENSSNIVQFHPFQCTARLTALFRGDIDQSSEISEYCSIFHKLKRAIPRLDEELTEGTESEHLMDLLREIDSIPDCARTARECLRALANLKVGKPIADADGELTSTVSKGIPCPADPTGDMQLSVDEARKLVWKHLMEADSAWTFTMMPTKNLQLLSLLSSSARSVVIPSRLLSLLTESRSLCILNFDNLVSALQPETARVQESATPEDRSLHRLDAMKHCATLIQEFQEVTTNLGLLGNAFESISHVPEIHEFQTLVFQELGQFLDGQQNAMLEGSLDSLFIKVMSMVASGTANSFLGMLQAVERWDGTVSPSSLQSIEAEKQEFFSCPENRELISRMSSLLESLEAPAAPLEAPQGEVGDVEASLVHIEAEPQQRDVTTSASQPDEFSPEACAELQEETLD